MLMNEKDEALEICINVFYIFILFVSTTSKIKTCKNMDSMQTCMGI